MVNPEKKWFFWGISSKESTFLNHSYNDKTVVGMCSLYYYKPYDGNNNGANFDPTLFGNCEIDMYLDLDLNELRMCIVGKPVSCGAQEAVWYNISDINKSGWVPHFNFSYRQVGTQKVQVAKIPLEWYGKEANIQWSK